MEISTIRESAHRADPRDHTLLLPHQLATMQAMLNMERDCTNLALQSPGESVSTRHGILGDKPGSGKSYVVSELLLNCHTEHIPPSEPVRMTMSPHLSIITSSDADVQPLDVNILVVPHNIVTQWTNVLRYFTRQEPNTGKYVVVWKRSDISRASETIVALRERESEVRVMLVSAAHYPDILTILKSNMLSVSRIVFDEADSLRFRTPYSYPTVAKFYWFVTASIQNLFSGYSVGYSITVDHSNGAVQTSVNHRGSLSNSAYIRSFFGNIPQRWIRFIARTVIVADNAFIDKSFDLQPPNNHNISCTAPLHTRVLSGIVSQDIVQRLNAGDLETALMYMHPERTDSERNIITAALAQFNVELQNAKAEYDFIQRRRYANQAIADAAKARQEARVKRCEDNIRNVKNRIQNTTECSICYSDIRNKTVVPCCNNSFCLSCITTWVTTSPSCPLCKQLLHTTDFMVCCESPPREMRESYTLAGISFDRKKPKMFNLTKLLGAIAGGSDASERKLLFFCDNEYAIDNSGKQAMRNARIPFSALKGNSASINKRVREFNDEPGPQALLVNCSFYGCGLNLSSATDVIIYHTVDSRMDQQIIGRAQRPPRTSRLNVWRFVNCTEIAASTSAD